MNSILLISSEFPPGPGGIGKHGYSLARSLSNRFDVEVVTDSNYASQIEIETFDKESAMISTTRIPRIPILVYFIRIFVYIVKSWSYSNIILSGKFPIWSNNLINLFGRKKVTAIIHGSEVRLPSPIGRKLFYSGLTKSTTIVAVSRFTKSLLPNKLQDKAMVIPNGVDRGTSGSKTRDPDRLRLLTVGNITKRKGQHRVVKALPEIAREFKNLRYDLVGLPTEKEELKELISDLGFNDEVAFHGRLDEQGLRQAYMDTDIFFMLSENQPTGDVEGFGIAILEANSFGIPAIGARGCGIEDSISDGESGKLVDGDNKEEILKAVLEICDNYEVYSNGAELWAEQHSWDSIIKQYLKII